MTVTSDTLNEIRGLLDMPDATDDEVVARLGLIQRAGWRLVRADHLLADLDRAVAATSARLAREMVRICDGLQVMAGALDEAEIYEWLEKGASR